MSAQNKTLIKSLELLALYKTVTETWFHVEQVLSTKAAWAWSPFLSQAA